MATVMTVYHLHSIWQNHLLANPSEGACYMCWQLIKPENSIMMQHKLKHDVS
jgi:hypothetical protein